jgi:exopolyphosphatase/pppGpp-phosphohydrolase
MRPCGVVDLGSNTIRPARRRADDGCVAPVLTRRFRVGLGRGIEESGAIPSARITDAALVLAEVQRRLVVPLGVVDAGLREGALLDEAARSDEQVA